MKKISTTISHEMDFISLDKFLGLINIHLTKEEHFVCFDTQVSPATGGHKDDAYYRRCIAMLVSDKTGLKNSLISQSKLMMKFNNSLQELSEDMTVESLSNYGLPEYMVNVGPRMWMVTNPKDFLIYMNKKTGKKALACLFQGRLVINNILKVTKEQVQKDGLQDINGEII